MTIGSLPLGLFLMTAISACGDPAKPDQAASSVPAATQAVSASASATAAVTASAAPSAGDTAGPSTEGSSAPSATASAGKPVAAGSAAAPSASAKADGGEVKGEEKTGAAFTAYMTGSKSYKAGQAGTVTAIVNALGDYHVNPEYPYKVKLDAAPAGVSFPQDTVRDVSRSEKRATMSIPFTPSQAGSDTISGTISLSVCTKEQCVIEKAPVSVTVKVE